MDYMEYTREELRLSNKLMTKLNDEPTVGRFFFNVEAFNELLRKAFRDEKLFLRKYKKSDLIHTTEVKGIKIYLFLMKKADGFFCLGMNVGPCSTFVNQKAKVYCEHYGLHLEKYGI